MDPSHVLEAGQLNEEADSLVLSKNNSDIVTK